MNIRVLPKHLLPRASKSQIRASILKDQEILYTPYISRGFYFREFRESGAIRELINTRKYLPPIPTHECDLCTQYIALLDREFNHSRKCLKVPIREIYGVYSNSYLNRAS